MPEKEWVLNVKELPTNLVCANKHIDFSFCSYTLMLINKWPFKDLEDNAKYNKE